MKYTCLGIFFTFMIAGCATTPVSVMQAKQAPVSRLPAFQTKLSETTSTLVVTRDAGFLGGGCYYTLSINGTLAARLDVAKTARFFVVPGEILLRAGRDPQGKGLCGFGKDEWTQRETMIRPHETKYFRLSIDANGKTDI